MLEHPTDLKNVIDLYSNLGLTSSKLNIKLPQLGTGVFTCVKIPQQNRVCADDISLLHAEKDASLFIFDQQF